MGRNLHNAVRPEGGVPEFARLRSQRDRRRLTIARARAEKASPEPAAWLALCFLFSAVASIVFAITVTCLAALAADLSAGPDGPEEACRDIKSALHSLADAEHAESLALDLASNGGNSAAIVEARLSVLIDRTNDLRAALRRVRQSPVARDPMVEQCTRSGFRALVVSERLSTDVETVLFGGADSVAQAPAPRPIPSAPVASPPAQLP
jgi:hypothetical protein